MQVKTNYTRQYGVEPMKEKELQTEPAVSKDLFTGELLTLEEVAHLLKISRKTLYAWKAKGKIRFVKVAGTITRIPRAALADLITHDTRDTVPLS